MNSSVRFPTAVEMSPLHRVQPALRPNQLSVQWVKEVKRLEREARYPLLRMYGKALSEGYLCASLTFRYETLRTTVSPLQDVPYFNFIQPIRIIDRYNHNTLCSNEYTGNVMHDILDPVRHILHMMSQVSVSGLYKSSSVICYGLLSHDVCETLQEGSSNVQFIISPACMYRLYSLVHKLLMYS
jgi:hypothetical protein